MSFPGIDREKRNVLQINRSFRSKENAEYGFWMGNAGLQDDLILFPFVGVNRQILCGKSLTFTHWFSIDKFDPQCFFRTSLRQTRPNRKAILLSFLDANTEKAFVIQTGMFVSVSRIGKAYIMRITFKRSVIHQCHFAIGIPSHQMLGELERAVLYQFRV